MFASQPIEFLIIRPMTAGVVVIVSEVYEAVMTITFVHATVDFFGVPSAFLETVTIGYSPGGIMTRTFVKDRTDNVILETKVFLTGWTVFLTGWAQAYIFLDDWARINVSFDDWART